MNWSLIQYAQLTVFELVTFKFLAYQQVSSPPMAVTGILFLGHRPEGQDFHSGALHLRAAEVRVAGSPEEVGKPYHVLDK